MKTNSAPLRLSEAAFAAALFVATARLNLPAAEFPAAWKNMQPVTVERAGLIRFGLPIETIDAARPALEDLRIFDDAGREIPFDLERPVQRAAPTLAPRKTTTTVQPAATVVVAETGLDRPLRAVTLQTPAREFLKAARVEGSEDGANWRVLADGVPVFAQRDGASQRRIELPPQAWRHLRLTLDDQRSPPIPVTGLTLHAVSAESAPAELLPVEIIERTETEQETLLTLRFAAANVTLAGLTVLTDEPLFTRAVRLRERRLADGEAKEFTLASGSLYRLALPEQRAVSNLTFAVDAIAPARELILALRNDDNPPLQITGVRAERRPVLATLLAPNAGKLHLLSGNSQCAAPRYDLAQLRGSLKSVQPSPVQAGALAANGSFRAPDPLAALAQAGATLDVAAWKFRKAVRFAGGGAQQLELDLETLAHAAPSLADLRLMSAGKQIPFLIERGSWQRSLAVSASGDDDPKRPRASRWRIALPHAGLPVTKLTCETGNLLFRRDAALVEEIANERGEKFRVTIGSAQWVRTPEQKAAKLSIAFSQPPRTDRVWLEVENGDNPPLVLSGFTVWHPTPRVLFHAAGSSALELYYGRPQAAPPRYDLDLVARQMLSANKTKATLAAEERLKKPGRSENLPAGKAGAIFWIVLALVTVGLLVVLARLLPKSAPPA